MKSTLAKPNPKIEVDEKILLSFEETVLLKDFDPNKIKEKLPKLSKIIDELINLVPKNKYITVDVMMHNFKSKSKTCTDPSFHVDGIGNQYALWSIGDFRTQFIGEALDIQGLGTLKPRELIEEIKSKTNVPELKIVEIENSVPVTYDSGCIHKGRIAEAGHKRIMIRICSSDYIKPKNVDLKKTQSFGSR